MRVPLRFLAVAAALSLTAACSSTDANEPTEEAPSTEATQESPTTEAPGGEDTIVVSYNSPTEWANWGGVLSAFTESTGTEAPNDPKNSGQTLAALEAEAAAPAADTAYYGIVFGYQAVDADVVTGYKPAGFDDIPEALKDPEGKWFTVHQGAIAFIVNTDELGGAPVPQCWGDLTDPQYKGMVGYLDPTQAAVGYSVLTAANLALGGDFDDATPGLEWAAAMKGNGVVNPVQTATASVQQGEIPILIDADFNGHRLAAEGSPIEVVYPCEGSLAIPYVMSLVKNAPHESAGRALLDYALSDEAQALFAESYLRPVRDVEVPAEIAAVFPSTEEYNKLVATPDFKRMQEVQEDVVQRYEAEIIG